MKVIIRIEAISVRDANNLTWSECPARGNQMMWSIKPHDQSFPIKEFKDKSRVPRRGIDQCSFALVKASVLCLETNWSSQGYWQSYYYEFHLR